MNHDGRSEQEPAQPSVDSGLDAATRALVAREYARQAADREASAEAVASTLVSDLDRDAVVAILEEAFVSGRIAIDDLQRRTDLALRAHDRGDLDEAADGLVAPRPVADSFVGSDDDDSDSGRGWRLAAFVFMAVVSAPFLFLSAVFLFGGVGWTERVFGLVLAVLFLPGLVAIGRWAIRR